MTEAYAISVVTCFPELDIDDQRVWIYARRCHFELLRINGNQGSSGGTRQGERPSNALGPT